jgi:glucose/arabinose dehydrogenase
MTRPLRLAPLLAAFAFVLVPRAAATNPVVPANFAAEVLVPSLTQPNSFAFLPDGRVLFTEQVTGRVRLIVGTHVAATDPVLTVPGLNTSGTSGERGLQGVAVDPAWPQRPYVYLDYTSTSGFIIIVRYTASGDLANPLGESLVLGSPYVIIGNIPDNSDSHNAGCLRFGLDGMLYAAVGEDLDRCAAQDPTQLKGKILRLDVRNLPPGAGSAFRAQITPADNPFASSDSTTRLVFALGLRNPWRFVIDRVTQNLYVADPGDFSFEEVDEVSAGDNEGWPWREGVTVEPVGQCPEPGGGGSQTFDSPIVVIPHDGSSQAVITAGVHRGAVGGLANWPNEYEGILFYGDYYGGYLRCAQKVGGTWVAPADVPGQPDTVNWMTGMYSQCDYQIGPDGSLYWLRQFDDGFGGATGAFGRIRYTGPPNAVEPTPRNFALRVTPNPSAGPTEVTFALREPGPARVEIFDTQGRRVRTLADVRFAVGAERLTWDGADERGAHVPAGVYLVRLSAGRATSTVRLLRIE